MGSIAIKRFKEADANLVLKFSRIFGREFSGGSAGFTRLSSSWGVSASMGFGYSFLERWRVGAIVSPDYQSPVIYETDGFLGNAVQRLVWNAGLTITYLVGSDSSVILSYNDQTREIGPAINTALSRTATLAFTKRFER